MGLERKVEVVFEFSNSRRMNSNLFHLEDFRKNNKEPIPIKKLYGE